MRRTALVVACLMCAVLVRSPGVAATQGRLTLHRPTQVSQTVYRLSGRVSQPHRSVVLQSRVDGHWVKTARLRAVKRVYRTEVAASTHAQKYRTVAGRLRSKVRTVPALPAPLAPADACGAPLIDADGTRRGCTFADDFNGSQLDRTKWVPQTNFITGDGNATYACYHDDPDNVSVSDGALHLSVRKEPEPLPCGHGDLAPSRFTGGGVSTYHLFSQQYGRFEARFKNTATTSPGLQEAFWLWPDDRENILVTWPEAGEIDVIETYSQYYLLGIPFLHYTPNDNGGPIPGLNTEWNCGAQRGVWNTYALEWTPLLLRITVNGETCLLNTSANVAFQRKYILALTQGLGTSTNGYVNSTPMPATMSVDYVRVWEWGSSLL
ncbi:MAG: glycoside hydrolase family 16 protein [Nocardioides sp.]|nr:glycoside hydrolase family 16 protein [Nocardioides sp.]